MFGQVNLGEVVFISVYRVSIFLVQIRLVMEIMGVKSRAAHRHALITRFPCFMLRWARGELMVEGEVDSTYLMEVLDVQRVHRWPVRKYRVVSGYCVGSRS